ncbi:MAG TPA: carboxymuconolactone decarboxylase family protein [Dehalococcoidia bacterium]|nr:carboxymuconolactone decarboxylase family protein [Dehalococcoidia bacterium]
MARLPYRTREELPEQYRYLFDNLARDGGRVGNIFRTLAWSPNSLHQFLRLGNAILNHSQLDPHLRELAILTVGRVTEAVYEYDHHIAIARRVGVTEQQIDALPVWERHPAFNEQERAVIRYAETVTRDVRVSNAVFDACHAFLGNEQMVELALAVGFYNLAVRFLEPMQVELE